MQQKKSSPKQDQPTRLGWVVDVLARNREVILSDFEARLCTIQSPLVSNLQASEQLKVQAHAIIEDVIELFRTEPVSIQQSEDRLSEAIGISRAGTRMHPSVSLRAALELSDAMLFAVLKELPPHASREEVAEVASATQRVTIERVARASVSYIDSLLHEASQAHAEERRRIGRELHDRVANSLAVVHRNVDLYEVLKEENPFKAEEKLSVIRSMAREAIDSARELSAELRWSVCQEGLEAALSNLLPMVVPRDIRAVISVKGDESLVPGHVKNELFLILREALRNAVTHSGAGQIRIELSFDQDQIRAAVRDDGRGFHPESENSAPGVGLESMRERAHLLGGTFHISSHLGRGTVVAVNVLLVRT